MKGHIKINIKSDQWLNIKMISKININTKNKNSQ